jgi:hypothetical protein
MKNAASRPDTRAASERKKIVTNLRAIVRAALTLNRKTLAGHCRHGTIIPIAGPPRKLPRAD